VTIKKYDIAISFLQQDEALAWQLHDNLITNFNVFVYSKKLEDVGATDGLEKYREVFTKQANVTVVLYRAGWGKTKFTALEESAIKDFCLNNQYKGLVLVRLDAQPVPRWVPDTHIYIDYSLYQLEGTVGVIKLRSQEAGVEVRQETSLDRAKRAKRRKQSQTNREIALDTRGGEAARAETTKLFESIKEKICNIQKELPSMNLDCGYRQNELVASGSGHSMRIIYFQTYGNIIRDVPLECQLFNARLLLPGESGFFLKEPSSIEHRNFKLDYDDNLGWHWEESNKKSTFTSNLLGENLVSWFVDKM